MAKIYASPKHIQPPELTIRDVDEYWKECDEYIKKVQEWVRAQTSGEYIGEVVNFTVCDGYAKYVVWSLKPVKLIHLDIADGYQFQYANRLTAKDIKDKINYAKALDNLFNIPKEK